MTMTKEGVKPATENDFMSKPGRWNGPDCSGSGLPPRGSKGWLEARLARSAPANQPGLSAEATTPRTEAEQLAYNCGIAGVAPIAQRLIDLEGQVAELIQTIQRLEKKR
jgi:hypothetical protein